LKELNLINKDLKSFSNMKTKKNLVGAHTSIAGGVFNSIYHGSELGAETIQIFTANQRQWQGKPINDQDAEKFLKAKKETGITTVMSHTNYLINLGSFKKNVLYISQKAFKEEIERCHLLEIDYLVFHPGSAVDTSEEKCLDTIVASLLSFALLIERGKTRLLLETTAGQGSNIGYKFEHLAYIIKKVENKIPIGVCLDTCHIFAAGYDIRNTLAWEDTLSKFSKIIGIKHLYAFHLNDSKTDLGSRIDRHESIGKGKIGLDCFKYVMKEPKFKDMPKILETPDDSIWKEEIKLLKKFAG
jgi:deoxyribonuclease-4